MTRVKCSSNPRPIRVLDELGNVAWVGIGTVEDVFVESEIQTENRCSYRY